MPASSNRGDSAPAQSAALLAFSGQKAGAPISRSLSPSRAVRRSLSRQATGGSVSEPSGAVSPSRSTGLDPISASFIAATLAASRSASPLPSPNHTGQRPARSPRALPDGADGPALAPHPPGTKSLISMFDGSFDPVKRPSSAARKLGPAAAAAAAPKPISPQPAAPAVSDPSSDESFASAPSTPIAEPSPPVAGPRPPRPRLLRDAPPLPPRRMGDLPLDSLTSAIVASSLASARHPAPAPLLPPPPPVSRRHHTSSSPQRETPRMSGSPPRRTAMLQTLRPSQAKSDDEAAARRPRKNPLVSGKHKHHEGARRRWKEAMTARERKRYEAVWASNRGLFVEPAEDCVSSIVVRDLWSRSRLPFDELAEVWDLVDNDRRGALVKAEFVVGMWLIDQRLRGRKIPPRVSETVWSSATWSM